MVFNTLVKVLYHGSDENGQLSSKDKLNPSCEELLTIIAFIYSMFLC